jgi:opacity protein-like surface antigen
MKNNETGLEGVLQEWRVTTPLPPRFSEQVWKRIERADAPSVSVFDAVRAWFAMAFARPAFAVAYVSVLITAGLALGFVQANHKAAQWDRQLEARYVQSIDPYQKGQ